MEDGLHASAEAQCHQDALNFLRHADARAHKGDAEIRHVDWAAVSYQRSPILQQENCSLPFFYLGQFATLRACEGAS